VLTPNHPLLFLPLKTEPPKWFLFKHPFIGLYYSKQPLELELFQPGAMVTINSLTLTISDDYAEQKFEIALPRGQVQQLLVTEASSPIIQYLDCCEIVGSHLGPDHLIYEFCAGNLFTVDLLLAFRYIRRRPDKLVLDYWFMASELDFVQIFETIVQWALQDVANPSKFLKKHDIYADLIAAVFRTDHKFVTLADYIIASPGRMVSVLMEKLGSLKFECHVALVLNIIRRREIEMFHAVDLAVVIIRGGIVPRAEGVAIDKQLLRRDGVNVRRFDKFGAYPIAYKCDRISGYHLEAYEKVFEFLMKDMDEMRKAVTKIVARRGSVQKRLSRT
jgi:hypothetical protein